MSIIGLINAPKNLFFRNGTSGFVIAKDLPNPAVNCTNNLAPYLCTSFMYSLSSLNILLFWYSQRPSIVSLKGAMPGIISPTLFFALSRKKLADSLSKWFRSIQPKSDVPPIGHITILFFISTLPIFHGVIKGSYFFSIDILLNIFTL